MAIVHADSFDIYGNDGRFMLDGAYAVVTDAGVTTSSNTTGPITDPDGLSTQRCLRIVPRNVIKEVRYVLPSTQDIVGVALRQWLASIPASTAQHMGVSFRSNDNVELCRVETTPSGRIKVTKGADQQETVNPVVTAEGWWHLEMRVDGTAQTFELRVEGITKLEIDPFLIDDIGQVVLYNDGDATSAGPNVYFKDFTVWDGTGTQNNDFIGAVRVQNLTPTSDVALGSWTPSTGTEAFPILDNNPPVDTTYLSAPIGGFTPMQVELSNLPPDISSVRAVISVVRAAKTDGGDGKMQVSVISNGDASNGADRPITAAQIYWSDVHEVDPDTAAPWSPGAVDLAQLRIDRTL